MHVTNQLNNYYVQSPQIEFIKNLEKQEAAKPSISVPRRVFNTVTLPFQWIGQGIYSVFKAISYVFCSIFCCFSRSKTNNVPQVTTPAPIITQEDEPIEEINTFEPLLLNSSNTVEHVKNIALQTASIVGQGTLFACKATYWIFKTTFGGLYSLASYLTTSTPQNFSHGAQYPTGPNGVYNKNDLINIWQQTNKILTDGSYINSKGKRQNVQQAALQAAANTAINGAIIKNSSNFKNCSSKNYDTQISICSKDALDAAIELSNKGFNTAFLNPANAQIPGGGYKAGAAAMEEDICRRSALPLCLDSEHGQQMQNFYPFGDPNQIIYSPLVPIFRYGREHNYALLEEPRNISIVTSAAENLNPQHRTTFPTKGQFLEKTRVKIYKQLLVAAKQGHDAIVLTAFGCGAFCNSPKEIAAIYQDTIEKYFNGVFKKIVFAVIDDHNTGKAHNPKGNFHPFEKMVLRMGGTSEK